MTDISVVMAVKNEEKYISDALDSIVGQKDVDFEIVLVDDGSTDNTVNIIESYRKENGLRIRFFRNPQQGKCSAFNYGVAQSVGDFVCLFAGDDIMPEGALAARRQSLQVFGRSDNVVGLCKLKSFSEDKRFDGNVVPRGNGLGGFTGVSYLMSRTVARTVFPVPESLPNEDTWLEIAFKYDSSIEIVHCGVIGCLWRVHADNSINMQVDFLEYNNKLTPRMEALYLFFEKNEHKLNEKDRCDLIHRIECETARRSGSVWRVLMCEAPFVDRLRALSAVNSFLYNTRRMLFGIFSGW